MLEATPAFVAAVPSKVYEYLACGLAAVVTPLPRQADLVTAAGAGAVVASAGEAAALLESWAADPGLVEPICSAARAWAARELTTAAYDELASRVAALARGIRS